MQCRTALGILLQPHHWSNGAELSLLRQSMGSCFGAKPALFSLGREALLACLNAANIGTGDEVIVQGYTCIVVPNAIIAAGATPIYADIDPDTLNLTIDEVEQAITPRTKAVIVQHTFGLQAPLKELRNLCTKKNILLIEDLAHILPGNTGPDGLGTTGDMSFCSFGRDKAISGVSGGAAWSRHPAQQEALESIEQQASHVGRITIGKFLLYPLLYAIAKPLMSIRLGFALLSLARICRLLVPIATTREKHGTMKQELRRLPNACAALAYEQWQRRADFNAHRQAIATMYAEAATKYDWPIVKGALDKRPLQKVPLFVEHAQRVRAHLKRRNIHLYDGWSNCTICPSSAEAETVGGEHTGENALQCALSILLLPCHPTMSTEQTSHLIKLLNQELESSTLPS